MLTLRDADSKRIFDGTRAVLTLGTALGLLITAAAAWSVWRDRSRRGLAEKALLESEEKYRGLLEAAPDAMVVVNQEEEIVLVNAQAAKQFGYPRDELVGKKVTSIIPEGFTRRLIADGTRSEAEAHTQQIDTGIELDGQRKDGSGFPIEIMLSPRESAQGILVTAAVRNITTRKDAERHLAEVEADYRSEKERAQGAKEEKARNQLIALEHACDEKARIQEEFLSHVSHELRTPLTVIYCCTTNILDGLLGDLSAEQHEHLQVALDNICQLTGMVGDLLDVTRIETDKLTLESRCESPIKLVAEAFKTCSADAVAKKVTLYSDAGLGLTFVWVDACSVRQILTNLIDNAIKFNVECGTVTVGNRLSAKDEGFLCISVSDTGCGISPENLKLIFGRLAQVASPEDGSRTGLGLGLFIAKELVSLHGGRIWVESELGRGSTVCFTLPVFSLGKLCARIFNKAYLGAGFVSLIALDVGSLEGGFQVDTLAEIRGILSHCIHPSLDVLLPAMNGTEPAKTLFIVACTDESGSAAIARRIERELRNFGNASQLKRAIASTTLVVKQDPSQDQTCDLLRRIDQLIRRHLKRQGKTSNSEKTILIIDDDPYLLPALSPRLETNGYRVISATNPVSAMVAARTETPDLIILDLRLPAAKDGLLLLQQLKGDAELMTTPVIVLSSADAAEAGQHALDAGATAFLRKPPDVHELLTEILHALGDNYLSTHLST
jgi:PAS domain S-box-containing protein